MKQNFFYVAWTYVEMTPVLLCVGQRREHVKSNIDEIKQLSSQAKDTLKMYDLHGIIEVGTYAAYRALLWEGVWERGSATHCQEMA